MQIYGEYQDGDVNKHPRFKRGNGFMASEVMHGPNRNVTAIEKNGDLTNYNLDIKQPL